MKTLSKLVADIRVSKRSDESIAAFVDAVAHRIGASIVWARLRKEKGDWAEVLWLDEASDAKHVPDLIDKAETVVHPVTGKTLYLAHTDLGPDGTLGTVAVGSPSQDFPTGDQSDYLEVAGALLSSALQKEIFETELKRLDHQLEGFFDTSAIGLLLLGQAGVVIEANDVARKMLDNQSLVGSFIQDQSESPAELAEVVRDLEQGSRIVDFEFRSNSRSGVPRIIILNATALMEDRFIYSRCFLNDVTERKMLEEQILQAQKLEAIGRLAGGIAHDFNNILTALLGHAELALAIMDPKSPAYANVESIAAAGDRAASLTNQLLAFARKQVLHPQLVDINEVVEGVRGLLDRLIGANVRLKTSLQPNPFPVMTGVAQFEQVLINLALNARDAMPQGGRLIFSTRNVVDLHPPDLPKGDYVELKVKDTGIGMDAKTLDSIFDPFFTTKEVGKGTGLGLSTSYGIIKQSGGNITVKSQLGKGTTFTIHLPRAGVGQTK
jgi:PAS domain S-box-containing protein